MTYGTTSFAGPRALAALALMRLSRVEIHLARPDLDVTERQYRTLESDVGCADDSPAARCDT